MIHEFTMSNGLKVIGIESHKSPVVSVQAWVRNGSADERSGDEGLSHFIEHLVFKGTKNYGVGEIAAKVEACGGEINAYTSFDQTVFYITISKQFFHTALDIVSDMMGTPLFDPLEIDREREVVVEEIKRSQDSLSRQASRLLFSNMYEGHPYAVPVIGYESVVRGSSPEQIRRFFEERYVPENMFLLVTGDFQPAELPEQCEKYFSKLRKKNVQIPQRPLRAVLSGKKVIVEKAKFEEAVFYISWPGIDIQSKDLAAMECLSLILGQGASSRLYRALRMDKALVNSVGAGAWAPAQTKGFFSISGSLNSANFAEVMSTVRTEIEKLFLNGVTEDELRKAKINFLSEEAYALETVGGLARKYGGNFDSTRNLYFHEEFQKQLAAVTVNDVLRVAQQYLQTKDYIMAAVVPSDEDKLKTLFKEWTFSTQTQTAKIQNTASVQLKMAKNAERNAEGKVQTERSAKGMRSFYRENSAAPVFNLRVATLGGSYVVPPEKAGLAELVGRVWTSETQQMSEAIFQEKTDQLASSLYSFAGKNTFGLVVDGLTEFQRELSELFMEVIEGRKINQEIVEREKKMMLEALRSRKDSPSYVASLNFQQMLFAGHPYAQDTLGDADTLKNISALDVESYIQSKFSANQTVCAISGDFDSSLWREKLDRLEQVITSGAAKMTLTSHQANSTQLYKFQHADKEQTHLIYGFKALSLQDKDRYTLQVIEAVLAGQGGRLFLELRDKASLAYSVSPMRMEGLGTGYFATYIGCSPEKTETALQMMKDELEKLMQQKIPNEELQRAQNYLIGGHDIGLQKNSSIASSIAFNEIYGNSYEELFNFSKHIRAVSAEKIQTLAQRLFSQNAVISVVGPREPKLN